MIEYIDIRKLHEHPDNPRKAIGDVTELMNSIRKQGLLQNLTVVPHPEIEGEYRIVIGHRRFNAAKKAGLSELPCVIDRKMDRRAQIAVMMSENMQRNDLTIAERVGGVQMMMDLGLDVKQISKDTGLSESSVRRYKKLTDIQTGIKAAEEKGLTLFALEKIAEIPYEDLREEALNKADYQHIQYKVQTRQAREKTRPSLIETFKKFAEEVKTVEYSRYSWIKDYRFTAASSVDDAKKFKPDKEKKYVFAENEYYISLYAENKKTGADEQKQKDAERLRQRAKHEKEIAQQFRFARCVFMSEIRIRKEQEEAAMRFCLWVMSTSGYLWQVMIGGAFDAAFLQNRPERPRTESLTGSVKVSTEEILEWNAKDILTACVTAAYDRIDQGDGCLLDHYTGKPKEENRTKELRTLYVFLEMLGYRKSDEEEAWLDGTHECYSFPHDAE